MGWPIFDHHPPRHATRFRVWAFSERYSNNTLGVPTRLQWSTMEFRPTGYRWIIVLPNEDKWKFLRFSGIHAIHGCCPTLDEVRKSQKHNNLWDPWSRARTRTRLSGRTLQTHQTPCFHCHPEWTSTVWYLLDPFGHLYSKGNVNPPLCRGKLHPQMRDFHCHVGLDEGQRQAPHLVDLFEDAQDFLDHRLLIPGMKRSPAYPPLCLNFNQYR